jgi:molecular chaperone DnaK
MMPYLRQRLADRTEGLGIPLEFGVDPLTVVARGAAVFARTQRMQAEPIIPLPGRYAVELEYKPAGPDPEPLVGGKVVAPPAANLAGHTIEFVNVTMQPPWRSGKIGLSPDGGFMTTVQAQKGPENKFLIELHNAADSKVPTVPEHFTYVIIVASSGQPLIHSMGIGLANNEMESYFNKGEALPIRRRKVLLTAAQLRRGRVEDVVRVPVMEGQKVRADRNHHIGSLEIKGSDVKRDVPPGSEIEVTLEIDRSRLILVKAYVPVLNEEFENMLKLGSEEPNRARLQMDFGREKARLEKLRQQVKETRDAEADKALFRIDGERMLHDVEVSLAAMTEDPDAGQKCQDRLLDLKGALDEVEDKLAWPALVASARKEVEVERNIVNDATFKATHEEKEQFAMLERETRAAIGERDPDLLRRKVQEMDRLGAIIVLRHPGWWLAQFERFEKEQCKVTDAARAAEYIAQGRRAVNDNDAERLKAAVRQLFSLLPPDDADRQRFSDVMRSA